MSPKTHVFTKEIQRVTPKGFIDDKGEEHEVDVIICATG
jgi:cation diffusion facilitator CzcD-associated flavoprotein CzcO